ncbi:MAG: acetate--CoA ligase family protein [Candidatus Zixiibacteriota bacterium]|nr:MAG: acetate--CoA ligase family protein [candidate division Zixibacteria bacterium]
MKHELDHIFKPSSVAVIGASTRKGTIGRETLHNILMAEFTGKVFPVNPKASVIHSIKAYSTVRDVPDAVDLAILIIPKEGVIEVARQCGEKGVKGLIVISAGFSEVGPEGERREEQLTSVIQEHGIRMIGPNCFGIVNTDTGINLNATFGKTLPMPGNVGFITQSGAMGEAILAQAKDLGIGFSIVASIGNKADISSNDILEYLKDDPRTDVILLYLENFGNPRNFTRIAREVSRIKPIVAVKSGRTKLGSKAASSHTGALGGLDVGVDALFTQTGVMRVDSVEELFDVARALSAQPIPKGNRVVVVTNAGGPGILATDALVNYGMEMPSLAAGSKTKLKKFVSADASISNPLDLVAGAGAEAFGKALKVVREDKSYDTIMPIFVPPVTIDDLDVARSLHAALEGTARTVLSCFMGVEEKSRGVNYLKSKGIPVFKFPEAVAKTLSTIDQYRHWRKRPRGKHRSFEVDSDKVRAILRAALDGPDGAIVGDEAIEILKCYGIPAASYQQAFSAREAASVARSMGYPVVMKIASPEVLHKTEVGGVMVDLRSDKEVRDAFAELRKRVGRLKKGEKYSVAIQQMISGAVETVMGMTTDPSFGPLIMFGLGGIYVEIMKDVSFRISPVTDSGAREMIRSLRSYPLLTGFRGAPPVDLEIVEETLLRLSQLVKDFDCFSEIDINPFIVSSDPASCKAVDARIICKDCPWH